MKHFVTTLTLQVAATATEVEVAIDARDVLATSSASVGEALSESQVSALPLVGGDVSTLSASSQDSARVQGCLASTPTASQALLQAQSIQCAMV
jgi:hypothetical protein